MSFQYDSNANFFSVRIEEDTKSHTIKYYPVYGDASNEREFDINMMNAIETGVVSMYDSADMDKVNQGMDDFIEMYGEEVYRWVIVNELQVTYNYDPNIAGG